MCIYFFFTSSSIHRQRSSVFKEALNLSALSMSTGIFIGYKTVEPVAGKQIIHIIRKKVDIAFPHVRLSSEQHNRSKNHVTVSHRSQFHYMYINIRHNCISYLVYTETSRLCPVLFLRFSLCKSPIPSHPYSENPYPSFLRCIFCHLIHRNGQRGTAVSDLCNNTQSHSA